MVNTEAQGKATALAKEAQERARTAAPENRKKETDKALKLCRAILRYLD